MHHADYDAHADLERRASLARACCCAEESAREHRRFTRWIGFLQGWGLVAVCVLGYAVYRLWR